ncbi:MAG: hypothetical protein EOP49_00445 [Sphingobacteriales bacterium]|nr:MAG: hypothetical protein EOP49_00445 [Sphingobacteriales bacterium]
MKKNLLGVFLLFLLVFTACARQKKTAEATTAGQATTANSTSASSLSYIKMQRTPCFGRCPYYSVEIYDNGLVRYTGMRFVKDSGIYEKQIDKAQAAKYLAEFQRYRVDTLKKNYDVLISDIPGINYTFRINNELREVRNAHFGPVFLKTLGHEVDALVKYENELYIDKSWKKVSAGTKDE